MVAGQLEWECFRSLKMVSIGLLKECSCSSRGVICSGGPQPRTHISLGKVIIFRHQGYSLPVGSSVLLYLSLFITSTTISVCLSSCYHISFYKTSFFMSSSAWQSRHKCGNFSQCVQRFRRFALDL